MSTPFTKVTPRTAINDPVIWRELMISLAERAPENDVFFAGVDNGASLQQVMDTIHAQMGMNTETVAQPKGCLQDGSFWNIALGQVVGFSVVAGLTVEPQSAGGTVVFSNYTGSEPYSVVTGGGIPAPWSGIKLFRKIGRESELSLIHDEANCPRGNLTKGDIIGWWTLEDLQRAMSVIRYHHYGSFGTIIDTGIGGSTSGRAVHPFHMAGYSSRSITKTLHVWDHPREGFALNDTLRRTIGPTIEPIASLVDGLYDHGTGGEPWPFFYGNSITVEYDWTYFGVQP